ncbi:hypothetical protein [Staphylococcus pseudintermedius]|uniref:hypothetical protein n=1 Tax=Staphylococcus pseudintermedius TaxID=283734 RepID=UPI001F50CB22|nr:hypothetical protein [Staphylococcus pseudintermedius]
MEETHAKVTQLEQPLAVIDTMLTLDGKIPLEIARQSLNFEQWAIYQHLAHGTCLFTDENRQIQSKSSVLECQPMVVFI